MADHDHEHDLDWAAFGADLERAAEVQSPLYADAVRWVATARVRDADVRQVVDLGAGPGVITGLLADAFPSALVVAIDGSPELLERAAHRASHAGHGARVQTRVAELPDGLDDLTELRGTTDLVWMSHVLHHLGDQQDAVRRVGSLLRPGGLLALAEGGLPSRMLPRDIGIGRPGLEARLDAANEHWFAEMRAGLPGAMRVVEHWPTLLDGAGLIAEASRTFLLDVPAPLDGAALGHVRHRLERARETQAEHLDDDDLGVLDELLDADGPHALERRHDVFVLSAATVHLARAGER